MRDPNGAYLHQELIYNRLLELSPHAQMSNYIYKGKKKKKRKKEKI